MVQQVNWLLKAVFNISASLWDVDAPEAVDLPSVLGLNKCQSWTLTDEFYFYMILPSSSSPHLWNIAKDV